MHIKFRKSVLLTITTFLLSLLLSLKTRCISRILQSVKRFMLLVRHDKHVYKINSNKRKISFHSLKFSWGSLLFVGIYKNFKIHTYIILMSVVR